MNSIHVFCTENEVWSQASTCKIFDPASTSLSSSVKLIPSMYSVSKMKFDRKPHLQNLQSGFNLAEFLAPTQPLCKLRQVGLFKNVSNVSFFDPLLQALWRNLRNRTVNGTLRNRNFDPNTDPFRASYVFWRGWYATNLAKKNQTMPIMVIYLLKQAGRVGYPSGRLNGYPLKQAGQGSKRVFWGRDSKRGRARWGRAKPDPYRPIAILTHKGERTKREEEENSSYLLFLLLHGFEWMDACDICLRIKIL